jgi:hypothetical protein
MMKLKLLAATVLSAGLLLRVQSGAQTHYSVHGPVSKAATDSKNVHLACPASVRRWCHEVGGLPE